jgi:Fe-S-cluster-containing hydrogenase component 2
MCFNSSVEDTGFMIIKCNNCSLAKCSVCCPEEALTLVAGDLLVVTEKCAVCKQYKGYKIPDCIAECQKSALKAVIEQKPVSVKRNETLGAYSMLRL